MVLTKGLVSLQNRDGASYRHYHATTTAQTRANIISNQTYWQIQRDYDATHETPFDRAFPLERLGSAATGDPGGVETCTELIPLSDSPEYMRYTSKTSSACGAVSRALVAAVAAGKDEAANDEYSAR